MAVGRIGMAALAILVSRSPRSLAAGDGNPVEVRFGTERGVFDSPVVVSLAAAAPVIRYTTDGRQPTLAVGETYAAPIRITNTTVLRAAAFSGRARVSSVSTHTYLFPRQIARQPDDPRGFPTGAGAWNGEDPVYGMDRRVVDDPVYRDRIVPALQALPMLCIAFARQDFFGPSKGIYVNPLEKGADWERPCSVEFIPPGGGDGFQIDCGIRVQGNFNRRPDKTPKHALRLLFKKEHGPAKLHYRMFPDSPVKRFDTLVLRADYNNSWIHWDSHVAARGQRIRDAWMKDSQRAMGWPAPHNRFIHLFLDGLYWGVYDVAERPDAGFAAAYFGGEKEEYDVINESEVKGGSPTAYRALRLTADPRDAAQFERLRTKLDLAEYIDYLLLNYYGGNRDWGENKNWYAVRRHHPPGPFRFLVWDGEQIFQGVHEDVVNRPYETPFELAEDLRGNPEFRLAFADRVQKHCFGNGALTPPAVTARWMARAAQLDLAIIAESARWGGFRRDPPYNRDQDWLAEQGRLVHRYFPVRTGILVGQLKAAGLYPQLAAPVPRRVADGTRGPGWEIAGVPGVAIYYTTDGTDPRTVGTGRPAPTARLYDAAGTGRILGPCKIRALKGREWSALVEVDGAGP